MFTAAQQSFIERQRVARLATTGPDGRPHVVPICFALLDGRLYSVVDDKPKRSARLRRLRNVAADPRATLLFDRYDGDWSRLAWVMVYAAADLAAGAEASAAIDALKARYPQYATLAAEGRAVLRFTPERVLSWGLESG
jgi:PPOX class probable F420-dependent enzyme